MRNIIKDTDNHNAALLAKEAAESKARLERLTGTEHGEKRTSQVGGGEIRRRQLGDIAAILGGRPSKRKRNDTPKKTDSSLRRVNTSCEDEEPTKNADEDRSRKRPRRDESREGKLSADISKASDALDSDRKRSHRGDYSKERSYSEDRRKDDHRRRRRDHSKERSRRVDHRRRRSRSRSPKEESSKDSRRRHRSPKATRSGSEEERSYRPRTHRISNSGRPEDSKHTKLPTRKEEVKPDYDSDPLDEIIGPRPPPIPEVKTRGRGAMSFGAGIDSRFSASYDPSVDVQLDPNEENDWDQALEALRDRQKWKQQGADRLRAAGFTDDEVAKWEKGGEKREADVKWAKSGEGREWDKGKVVDDEGAVDIDPDWGRLKGT